MFRVIKNGSVEYYSLIKQYFISIDYSYLIITLKMWILYLSISIKYSDTDGFLNTARRQSILWMKYMKCSVLMFSEYLPILNKTKINCCYYSVITIKNFKIVWVLCVTNDHQNMLLLSTRKKTIILKIIISTLSILTIFIKYNWKTWN